MHEDKRVIEAHIRALMLSINDQPTIKFIDAPPFRLSIANDSSVNLFIRAPQGDEQSISLRPRESAILALLAAKQNTAVSTREILGSSNRDLSETESLPNGDKSVDVHICNIRRRMDGAAVGLYGENRVQPSCNLIETVRGRGYRLNQNYDGLRPQAALHTLNAKIDTPQQGG